MAPPRCPTGKSAPRTTAARLKSAIATTSCCGAKNPRIPRGATGPGRGLHDRNRFSDLALTLLFANGGREAVSPALFGPQPILAPLEINVVEAGQVLAVSGFAGLLPIRLTVNHS